MEVSGKRSREVLSASQLLASDDDFRLYCLPCGRDGSRVPAYGYCQDCAEHLCKSCYKVHLKPTPLRNHILLDSSMMPQSQQLSHPTPMDLTESCQLHSGKVIEYFCRDHNILGCSPCITINHRNCKIDYIPDASKNYDTSQEYQNLLDTLKTLHTSCKKLAQSAKDNKKKIQDSQDAIKEEIRKFRLEIDRILDNWEINTVQKVDQLLGEERVRVDSIHTESSKSTKEIEDLQKELTESQQMNELFCKVKKNEAKMKNYATALSQMQENNYIKNATFKRNSSIEGIIKTEMCLGEFTTEKDKSSHVKMPLAPTDTRSKKTKGESQQSDEQQDLTDTTKHSASSGPRNVDSQPLLQQPEHKPLPESARLQQQAQQPKLTYDKISATFSGKIDMTVPDDTRRCGITGIEVVSRDTLAITDNFNCKIKLVDTVHNKIVSSLMMSDTPWSVTTLTGDQLAVTLPDSCIIQVLSTSGGLSKVRQVKVDGYCRGLAYSDGHFVVGFQDPGKVQIMTSEGKVLQTIQYDKALFLFKKEMFIWPRYVTVDENNKTVYVSDAHSEGRGITRLNWEGKVTGVYKNSDLSGPHGILVLADGSLLVCNYNYNTIQLVSPDLTTSRIILQKEDGLTGPLCVAFNTEQNKLYVGCHSDNSLLLYNMK